MSTTAPNILLICTDQQRYDALGAAGNADIRTPNLDRLAAQGVRFDRCIVQSPVCAPSRASLMTSRYPRNHGLWANGVDMAPSETLFTARLAEAGYDCGLVGKFHLGSAFGGRTEPRVDDGFRVFEWSHDPYLPGPDNHYHRWLDEHFPGLLASTLATGNDAFDRLPSKAHYTHWVGERTISYLREGRDPDAPFCFVANFFDPHHGFGAPPEFRDAYDPATLAAPVTRPDELAELPPIYTEASQRSYAGQLPGFAAYSSAQIQQIRADYYAMVTQVDHEVGEILRSLDEEGLAENTCVIFTSDHGELLGDHQLLLKGPMMFDCSVRVPLLIRLPGRLPAGVVRDELVQWIDLAPTLLEIAGAPALERGQGRSLWELAATGRGDGWRDWALAEYRNSCIPYEVPVFTTMLRERDRKIVIHHGEPSTRRERDGELYDLVADPDELQNLWHRPEYAAERFRLTLRLLDVLVATEDRSGTRLGDY